MKETKKLFVEYKLMSNGREKAILPKKEIRKQITVKSLSNRRILWKLLILLIERKKVN